MEEYNMQTPNDIRIRYFVCGIAYNIYDEVTDYEKYFGDFDSLEEATEKFHQVVEQCNKDSSYLFKDTNDELDYWIVQLEKCECTDEYEECIDVVNEQCFYKEEA